MFPPLQPGQDCPRHPLRQAITLSSCLSWSACRFIGPIPSAVILNGLRELGTYPPQLLAQVLLQPNPTENNTNNVHGVSCVAATPGRNVPP